MKPRLISMPAGLCVLCLWFAAARAPGYELSHGRQVILNRGLQIQSLVYSYLGFSDTDQWLSSNATTFNFWCWHNPSVLASMPASQQWSRMWQTAIPEDRYLTAAEMPYANNLSNVIYDDEVTDLTTASRQADMAATYREWNRRYPDALVYSNSWGGQYTTAQLASYMQATQPDMIMFDHYRGYYSNREQWYATMQQYRTLGLAGNDGTGQSPIPYAQHLNLYRRSYSDPLFSESFVRLQSFASWAFGYTNVNDFIYKDAAGGPTAMFSTADDSSPTAVFNYVAEANRQSLHLGPALVRLVSMDIRIIPGTYATHQETYWDLNYPFQHTRTVDDTLALPDGIAEWSRGAGGSNYITGITPLGNDNGASHIHGDAIIGYFQPLLDGNRGCTFADGLHFMIVNGRGGADDELYGPGNSAANLGEWYRLAFDFTGSDFDSLVRLSRDTGKVELVTLASLGSSRYSLDLYLEGGTGDLFAFWNSNNPLPTIPEPSSLMLLGLALSSTFVYTWKRRR